MICHLAFMAARSFGEPVAVTPQPAFDAEVLRVREALAAGKISEANAGLQAVCALNSLPVYPAARAGTCYHFLGLTAMKDSRIDEAPGLFQRAAEAWRAAGPEYKETWGNTQLIIADLFQRQHRPAKATEAINRYLTELSRAEQSQRPEALSRLALAYADLGRRSLARATIQESLAGFEALSEPRPAEAAYARNTLGVVSLSMGRQEEAEANLRRAVELATQALGEGHLDTVGYQTNLALALLSRGDTDGAEILLRRARYVVEKQPGASGNQLGMICAELSAIAVIRNKLAVAGEEARKALDMLSHQKWPDQRAIALAQVNLADVHMHANRLAEAENLLNQAIPAERANSPDSRLLADGIRRVAQLRAQQQRWKEAAEAYREAIEIYDHVVGTGNPAVASLLREYAETLKREGGPKTEIREVESRAKALLSFAGKR